MERARVVGELRAKSRELCGAAHAENTRRAYEADWKGFCKWCLEYGRPPLPASGDTLALYLADESARLSMATLERRVVAIGIRHREAGLVDVSGLPEVGEVLGGLRRTLPVSPGAKAAVTVAELRRMLREVRKHAAPAGERDAALLLLGFAGGFRRAELVALDLADVQIERRGVVVHVRRSKTDQEGAGRLVAIARGKRPETCPVKALQAWLKVRGRAAGPLFLNHIRGREPGRLSGHWVAEIVQNAAEGCGLDRKRFGAHSLRAGLVTAAHEEGRSDTAIMQTTGHRSVAMVGRYIRRSAGRLFKAPAAEGLL